MLRTLFHEIREDLDVDAYFNFLVEENQPRLRLASCEGIPQQEIARIERLDFGEAICDYNRAEPGTADRRVWSETGCTCLLITSPSDLLC
jgi:hypothetical protein